MTIDAAIERIQFCYPQIYYACHTRHERKRSTAARLSHRDIELLVHLDRTVPMTPTALAYHMGLALSTISEAITPLEAHGYVDKGRATGGDRRRMALTLTPKGVAAVRSDSVLEPARLAAVLKTLDKAELDAVTRGLSLLASACRRPAPTSRRAEAPRAQD